MVKLEVLQVFHDKKTDKMCEVGQVISVTEERFEEMKFNFSEYGGYENYVALYQEPKQEEAEQTEEKTETTKRTRKKASTEE